MKKQSKIKLEHIDNLIHGKKSGIHVGSRNIGHHLFKWEREEYERALKRRYIIVDERSRENLWNVWEKVCVAINHKFVVLEKQINGIDAKIYNDTKTVFEGQLSEAKTIAKEIVSM